MSSASATHPAAYASLLHTIQANAARNGHRAAVALCGEHAWGVALVQALLPTFSLPRLLWLGDTRPEGVSALPQGESRRQLGQELDAVVLDAYAGFDAEAFGAVVGALRAGGLFLLLAPEPQRWREYADPEHARLAVTPCDAGAISGRFLQHVAATLLDNEGITVLRQDEAPPACAPGDGEAWRPPLGEDGMTVGQHAAVEAIERVAHGHRRRPLVVTSDRGRGKSAALGIAAARLLLAGSRRILVTAPRLAALGQLFAHAAQRLPGAGLSRGGVQWQGRRIEFVPPDALLRNRPAGELLLVDEAAAIPTPMLERMLAHYARIVFASTIHGYEGTGRGFALRFQRVLDERTPGWHALRLEQPVRWAEDDPLERFSFRALLLDAEPAADAAVAAAGPGNCLFEQLDRDALLGDARSLNELFGLLVLAHYRTSPNDLRHLLDGPNVRVCVLRHEGHVAATALVAREGGLPPQLAQAIYEGRRRAHGHLLPQTLAVHAGFAEAPLLQAERVIRIAVHSALQGRGLGRLLMRHIEEQAKQAGADYLGASFGATEELLGFWHRCGQLPVRVGLSREASSGSHSVMVMQPLSPAGGELFTALQARLAEQLPLLLAEPLADLDAALAAALFRLLPSASPPLSERDWQDVRSFAGTLRGFEVCLLALWRLAPQALAAESGLTARQRALLIEKVLQRRDWKALAEAHGLSGRAEAVAALRGVYRTILENSPAGT
jgi:tRNA(Met) cytidine acetyltransferase